MPASEAQVSANRRNSLLSTGPRTFEGKVRSRANSLKHGLTGEGVVLPEGEIAEVEARAETLVAEMAPRGLLGRLLARRIATLSVRLERCARQEMAAVAERRAHARARLDDTILAEVEHLRDWIASEPPTVARRLRTSPEGVALLLRDLRAVRAELTDYDPARWNWGCCERLHHIQGLRRVDEPWSRQRELSEAVMGNFKSLRRDDAPGLGDQARRDWARGELLAIVDAELAALEALGRSFDPALIEADRAGAADRSAFDPSGEATLARKYEAAAERGLYRALREFREAEAEVVVDQEDPPVEAAEPGPPLASSFPEAVSTARPIGSCPSAPRPGVDRPISGPRPTPIEAPSDRPPAPTG